MNRKYLSLLLALSLLMSLCILPAHAEEAEELPEPLAEETVEAVENVENIEDSVAFTEAEAPLFAEDVQLPAVLSLSADSATLAAGKYTTLRAVFEPASSAQLLWNLSDSTVATLAPGKNNTAKLTALKTITEPVTVTVSAVPADESTQGAECSVTLYPIATAVAVSANVPNDRSFDLHEQLCLSAAVSPENAQQDVKWSSSSKLITIDEQGCIHVDSAAKAATVTFTATARDGSGKKGTIKLKFIRMMTPDDLTLTPELSVASGKAVTIPFSVTKGVTNTKLSWTLDDSTWATLKNNKLTALKGLQQPITLTATATALDGSGVSKSCTVRVYPIAESVSIEGNPGRTIDLASESSLQLGAVVSPTLASQKVKWSSSNKLITVDENGLVSWGETAKAGNVTITAAATDGSGKKTTLKLSFGRLMRAEDLTLPSVADIAAGKALTLSYSVEKLVTNKKLSWSLREEDMAYATIVNNKLTAKTGLQEPTEVVVTATAADGSGISKSCVVTLTPVTERVAIFSVSSGEEITNTTVSYGEKLLVKSLPECVTQDWNIKCSNSGVNVSVDDTGRITYTTKVGTNLKDGSKITFTLITKDGSNKTAKVTLYVEPQWTPIVK